MILIFHQFFKGLPREIEDAAYIDGCGPFMTFVRVMAPNAASAFLTVFLFSVVWYWNDYFYTSTFLGKTQTLAVALSFLRVNLAEEMGQVNNVYESTAQMQAGCLLFIIPLLILYVFMQRFFVQGIERSGIVG
jgi:multiple sugar transport system permease protein